MDAKKKANLEAGRRKLEEFKRKKQEAASKKKAPKALSGKSTTSLDSADATQGAHSADAIPKIDSQENFSQDVQDSDAIVAAPTFLERDTQLGGVEASAPTGNPNTDFETHTKPSENIPEQRTPSAAPELAVGDEVIPEKQQRSDSHDSIQTEMDFLSSAHETEDSDNLLKDAMNVPLQISNAAGLQPEAQSAGEPDVFLPSGPLKDIPATAVGVNGDIFLDRPPPVLHSPPKVLQQHNHEEKECGVELQSTQCPEVPGVLLPPAPIASEHSGASPEGSDASELALLRAQNDSLRESARQAEELAAELHRVDGELHLSNARRQNRICHLVELKQQLETSLAAQQRYSAERTALEEAHSNDLQSLSARLESEHSAELQSVRARLESEHGAQLQSLSARLESEHGADTSVLQQELETRRASLLALEHAHDALKHEVEQRHSSTGAQEQALRTENGHLEVEVQRMNSLNAELDQRLATLTSSHASLEAVQAGTLDEAEATKTAMQSACADQLREAQRAAECSAQIADSAQTENERMRAELKDLAAGNAEYDSKLEEQAELIAQLESDSAKLYSFRDTDLGKIEALSVENQRLEEAAQRERESFEVQLGSISTNVGEESGKVVLLESRLMTLSSDLEGAQQNILQEQQSSTKAKADCASMKDKLANAIEQLRVEMDSSEELRAEADAAQEQVAGLTRVVATLEEKAREDALSIQSAEAATRDQQRALEERVQAHTTDLERAKAELGAARVAEERAARLEAEAEELCLAAQDRVVLQEQLAALQEAASSSAEQVAQFEAARAERERELERKLALEKETREEGEAAAEREAEVLRRQVAHSAEELRAEEEMTGGLRGEVESLQQRVSLLSGELEALTLGHANEESKSEGAVQAVRQERDLLEHRVRVLSEEMEVTKASLKAAESAEREAQELRAQRAELEAQLQDARQVQEELQSMQEKVAAGQQLAEQLHAECSTAREALEEEARLRQEERQAAETEERTLEGRCAGLEEEINRVAQQRDALAAQVGGLETDAASLRLQVQEAGSSEASAAVLYEQHATQVEALTRENAQLSDASAELIQRFEKQSMLAEELMTEKDLYMNELDKAVAKMEKLLKERQTLRDRGKALEHACKEAQERSAAMELELEEVAAKARSEGEAAVAAATTAQQTAAEAQVQEERMRHDAEMTQVEAELAERREEVANLQERIQHALDDAAVREQQAGTLRAANDEVGLRLEEAETRLVELEEQLEDAHAGLAEERISHRRDIEKERASRAAFEMEKDSWSETESAAAMKLKDTQARAEELAEELEVLGGQVEELQQGKLEAEAREAHVRDKFQGALREATQELQGNLEEVEAHAQALEEDLESA
eukprot:gene4059-5033_t